MRNLDEIGRNGSLIDSADKLASHSDEKGGKLEVNGSTFTWSNFAEVSNSYSYYENITGIIVSFAERAASFIDNVKKNVRIVDKWIDYGSVKRYLHVEKNSETLYQVTPDSLEVCMRYKNSSGQNVYEYYVKSQTSEYRTLYIPGVKYEFIEKMSDAPGGQYFIAENTKGFWECTVVGDMGTHYNTNLMVIKNALCYDVLYQVDSTSVMLKTISSDRKTDLFNFSDMDGYIFDVEVSLNGITGIKNVQVATTDNKVFNGYAPPVGDAYDVEYNKNDGGANLINDKVAVINLSNGKQIKLNDKFVNGNVELGAIRVNSTAFAYEGNIMLRFEGGVSFDTAIEYIKQFFAETGLTTKRDFNTVIEGIKRIYLEKNSSVANKLWNSYHINTNSGIRNAINAENAKLNAFVSKYEAIKNAEVIKNSDARKIKLNMSFAPITNVQATGGSYADYKVTFNKVTLSVSDVMLFVVDEPYVVSFALADANGDLTLLTSSDVAEVKFAAGEAFTVSAENVTVDIPMLSVGEYMFVAYISTADGIRSSGFVNVPFETMEGNILSKDGLTVKASYEANDTAKFTYAKSAEVYMNLEVEGNLDYAAFADAVFAAVEVYGMAEAKIEKMNDGTATVLKGNESVIEAGTYRVAYSVKDANVSVDGYVYIDYIVK